MCAAYTHQEVEHILSQLGIFWPAHSAVRFSHHITTHAPNNLHTPFQPFLSISLSAFHTLSIPHSLCASYQLKNSKESREQKPLWDASNYWWTDQVLSDPHSSQCPACIIPRSNVPPDRFLLVAGPFSAKKAPTYLQNLIPRFDSAVLAGDTWTFHLNKTILRITPKLKKIRHVPPFLPPLYRRQLIS